MKSQAVKWPESEEYLPTLSERVSVFNGVNAIPIGQTNWQSVLRDIQSDKYRKEIERIRACTDTKKRSELKKKLPAVTLGGVFSPRRGNENLKSPTGILVVDLDHLPEVESTFQLLSRDEKIFAAFRSPSGDGIKCLVRARGIGTDSDHKRFYDAIKKYFQKTYGLKIDSACKDIARLTFVSWDPNLFINGSPSYFDISVWGDEEPDQEEFEIPTQNNNGWQEKYGQKVLESSCEKIARSQRGEQHHTRLRMGRLIGGYIASGYIIDEAGALARIEQAVRASGAEDIKASMKTVLAGITDGKKKPIYVKSRIECNNGSNYRAKDETYLEDWQQPVTLDQPPLPQFDENDLPETLWFMAEAVAKNLEVPVELPALLVIAAAAAAIQKKYNVSPKQGYVEPLNIWVLVPLDSGNRKSSTVSLITTPLLEWEKEQRLNLEYEIKRLTIVRGNQDARMNALKNKYAKEKDTGKRDLIQEEMMDLSEELVEIPVAPRVFTQDVTPERLATLMHEQKDKMALIAAEGGIFDIIAGRYSNQVPNLDIFLQSHAGDFVRVDRTSRPSIIMDEPALSMALSTQPEVLRLMAEKPGFRDRGLIARFLYALPDSRLGHRSLEEVSIPDWVLEQYKKVITLLLNKPFLSETQTIHLEPEAHRLLKAFAHEVEKDLAEGGRFENMLDWGGKLPGAAARIAGIFHCVNFAEQSPEAHKIHSEFMIKALSLMRKLVDHALAAFDLMGCDRDIVGARKVLAWIKKTGQPEFTVRQCHNALQANFPNRSKDLDPVIAVLRERGYIRPGKTGSSDRGGRPSEVYEVNPMVL